ncbi:MAG TPA: hypothetical protein VFG39_09355, partial [Balneolaceae bacterium]|nr:hypothetical protein [Balneolaceae bacterium]
MEESTILETNFILLALTKSRDLEFLLSTLAKEENIRFESVEDAEDLNGQQPDDYIITFIIGSDVEDPIQSAQRLHAVNNRAKIILITKPDNIKSLKETVKFSPFIGTNVFCLDESNEEKLEKRVKEILRDSLKAEKYRSVVEE